MSATPKPEPIGPDQTLSDADQTASDADQRASDVDEVAAHADQLSADRDQRAADRDQAAADEEHAQASGGAFGQRTYDATRAERADTAATRAAATIGRARSELSRTRQATLRDETAELRDITALSRDERASAGDRTTAGFETSVEASGQSDPGVLSLLAASRAGRARAATDRARARADRQRAADDRVQAAGDRRESRVQLQRTQLDSLTGVSLRELGLVTVQHEVDRAHRSGHPFVLAFVDVDGLKELNQAHGHAAGDAHLQDVARALKSSMRDHDPIVRLGGDEFLCGFTDTDLETATQRVSAIRRTVAEEAGASASVSVGLAALQPNETLRALTGRADRDMYAQKALRAG